MFKRSKANVRKTPSMRFRCPSCTNIHDGFPALAYAMPDVIFALSGDERERRAIVSSDLCILDDERYFIRAILRLDVAGYEDSFEYGPWVEVDAKTFSRYAVWYNLGTYPGWQDAPGRIANAFPASAQPTLGLACRLVIPATGRERPSVTVSDDRHQLFADQANGMTFERVHALVSNMKGFVLLID